MPCRHEHHEPVELLLTGEEVARICVHCLEALPVGWDGQITEIHAWGHTEPIRLIPEPPDTCQTEGEARRLCAELHRDLPEIPCECRTP